MNTEKLLTACQTYKTNRDNQEQIKWNKLEDCDRIFFEMETLGVSGANGSAGFFMGTCQDGENLYANIGEEINIEKSKLDIRDWLKTLDK